MDHCSSRSSSVILHVQLLEFFCQVRKKHTKALLTFATLHQTCGSIVLEPRPSSFLFSSRVTGGASMSPAPLPLIPLTSANNRRRIFFRLTLHNQEQEICQDTRLALAARSLRIVQKESWSSAPKKRPIVFFSLPLSCVGEASLCVNFWHLSIACSCPLLSLCKLHMYVTRVTWSVLCRLPPAAQSSPLFILFSLLLLFLLLEFVEKLNIDSCRLLSECTYIVSPA